MKNVGKRLGSEKEEGSKEYWKKLWVFIKFWTRPFINLKVGDWERLDSKWKINKKCLENVADSTEMEGLVKEKEFKVKSVYSNLWVN